MVLVHLKRGDQSLFLLEAKAQTFVSQFLPVVVLTHNKRCQLDALCDAVSDLVAFGPAKEVAGYSETEMQQIAENNDVQSSPDEAHNSNTQNSQTIQRNGFVFHSKPDPTGRRIGQAAGEAAANVINKTISDARAISSSSSGVILTESAINEALENIKAALTIVYPEGIPTYDPISIIIGGSLLDSDSSKMLNLENTDIWWAGKELSREKKLADYIGTNEKTKIIVKIQKRGQGAPVREAPISEAEQKNMMAYYYRKQEEMKKLEENDEDDYLNSSWADTKHLKKAFTGVGGNVKFRP